MEIRIYVYIVIVYMVIVLGYAKSTTDRISDLEEIIIKLRSKLSLQQEHYRELLHSLQTNNSYHARNRREVCSSRDSSVVFHARQNEYINPIGENQIIVYDALVTNEGGAYDQYNGLFKAPVDGLYQFIATAWSTHNHYLQFEIVTNNTDICYGKAAVKNQAMGICAAVVELSRGDLVWVRHQGTSGDYADGKFYPSFAGHLIA